MLYLIGLGLWNEIDISLKGLEAVRKCDKIYLESYTSFFNASAKKLEKLYGRRVIEVDREFVEDGGFIEEARKKNVALLVIGDCFSATTHVSLYLKAKKSGIKVRIVHNASILTAIAVTGLSLYKFGAVASIPFDNKDVVSPYNVLKKNKNLHTLFLLDLNPVEKKFMTVNDAIKYLLRVSDNKKVFSEDNLCVACCALGSDMEVIKVGKAKDLLKMKFNRFPQCLIVPGKLHFLEEDFLKLYGNSVGLRNMS